MRLMSVSTEQYIADFKTFLSHYREDLYPTIPLFFCQLARSFTPAIAEKKRTDTTYAGDSCRTIAV